MLTDEVKIKVHAGKGGDGVVAFNKIKMNLGPTGGRGGNGGNVYFKGVSDLTALNKYKQKNDYYAENGKNGQSDKSSGHTGTDLFLTVPVGSLIHDRTMNRDYDITKEGQTVMIARGGIGGRGNFFFRSPINTSPKEFEVGKAGQDREIFIELRLIARVGLIGLPNAGKSSLLNELTKAQAKVGNYQFTTLEPNLGTLEKIVIADIPGLIEGASEGKGLGIKFLKHVQRTRTLLHCISAESDDMMRDYHIIRKELEKFSPELIEKEEIILLTKTDLLTPKELAKKSKEFSKAGFEVLSVSIHDWDAIGKLRERILALAE
jgi:GTP-binding protein